MNTFKAIGALFATFTLSVLPGCANIGAPQYDSGFSRAASPEPVAQAIFRAENDRLPHRIMTPTPSLENDNIVFFINQRYGGLTDSTLTSYDLSKNEISKEIAGYVKEEEYIDEYGYTDAHITWSVRSSKERSAVRIYVYNIGNGRITAVSKEFNTGRKGKVFPINLSIDGHHIIWIEQNMAEGKTALMLYDINSESLAPAVEVSFNDTLPHFPLATFAAHINDGQILYDTRFPGQPIRFNLYSIAEGRVVQQISAPDDMMFHFRAKLNSKERNIIGYGKAVDGDLIYVLSLDTGMGRRLSGFYPRSVVNGDILKQTGQFVSYAVQLNASGAVADHYFGEVYNITENSMMRYKNAFNIEETGQHFSILRFDPDVGPAKINLEVYKK